MKHGASRYPLPLRFLPDRERKRFLVFARNDECGGAVFSYRKPSSWEVCEAAFSLLPLEGGAPKGAEVGLRYRLKKNVRYAFPRFVIPSAVEGSFSLAVRRRVFDSRERETPYRGRTEAVLPLKGLAKGSWKKGTKKISRFRSK